MRTDVFHEGRNGKKLGYGETLLAATLAGSPSAWITTPAGADIDPSADPLTAQM